MSCCRHSSSNSSSSNEGEGGKGAPLTEGERVTREGGRGEGGSGLRRAHGPPDTQRTGTSCCESQRDGVLYTYMCVYRRTVYRCLLVYLSQYCTLLEALKSLILLYHTCSIKPYCCTLSEALERPYIYIRAQSIKPQVVQQQNFFFKTCEILY